MTKTTRPLSQLARIRLNVGISQYELAKRAGVSQQLVSLFERGLLPADPDLPIRLAAALGVAPESLTADNLTICTSPSGVVTVNAS